MLQTKPVPRLFGLCLLSAALSASPAASPATGAVPELNAGDWAEFRGPDHAGVADGAGLPSQFSVETGEHIAWTTPIPGLAHSSPIVVGDTVYVTTSVPIDSIERELVVGDVGAAGVGMASDMVAHSWRLYALDKHSGEILWHRVAKEGVPRVKRHVKASHASATPASNGQVVVAAMGSEGLFAYDLDGNLLWEQDLGPMTQGMWGDPEYEWGPASSPVIHEDLVILQNDQQVDSALIAFRLSDGEVAWRVDRNEKPSWSTPALVRGGRLELVVNGANWLTAYDPSTGTELWRFSNSDREVITPSPVVAGDQIVFTGGYPPGGHPIFVIEAGGSGDISDGGLVSWMAERSSPYSGTPIVYQGLLYAIRDNGVLSVFDMATGERLYRNRLNVGAGYTASPVASDNRIYFPSEDGDVMVVLAGREYELVAQNPMGEPLMASPAISGNTLFIRGVNNLFAVRAD